MGEINGIVAAFRYLALTPPLAWGGIVIAQRMDAPPLYGLILGLLTAAGISSLVFYFWLRAALTRVQPPA